MYLSFKKLSQCICLFLFMLIGFHQFVKAQINHQIQFQPSQLTVAEKQILSKSLASVHPNYDSIEKMVLSNLNGYNYHTDATSGRYHQVRASFSYAIDLLDLGDEQFQQRAFDILEKCISIQDTGSQSKTKGIWGYYLEEPLATKKSPPDFNWADFNGVTLLEVWMGHQSKIPERLKPLIQRSLILAAQSIQKRDITMSYTNIAIMGTYVTYMVSHLFQLEEMKTYSETRLKRFYDYTKSKGGFTEYNSPAYTIIAIDELSRMKLHFTEPTAKKMVDELYFLGWETIAKHYYLPAGQWVGPHSRSYSTLLNKSFYDLIFRASQGAISIKPNLQFGFNRVKHTIPKELYAYFTKANYPYVIKDVLENTAPEIIGNSYLTNQFSLSTANRSSLWNQRRPFLAYWGTIENPKYLQVRFLHDFYDFSSASFYSQQKENQVLAGINLNLDGGDKHISIDRIKDGKFTAKDLRIRFEFGKQKTALIPTKNGDDLELVVDGLKMNLTLYQADFAKEKGYWETGVDANGAWLDYVIYKGMDRDFDLNKIPSAFWGFSFSMGNLNDTLPNSKPVIKIQNKQPIVYWQGMDLKIVSAILPLPQHL